jgi:hypothetical protein
MSAAMLELAAAMKRMNADAICEFGGTCMFCQRSPVVGR